jgi:hypothetical protein
MSHGVMNRLPPSPYGRRNSSERRASRTRLAVHRWQELFLDEFTEFRRDAVEDLLRGNQ